MLRAKSTFDASYNRVLNIHELYKHLVSSLHFRHENVSDLLRSEIVYIISAFDKFIHDVVRIGMLETFNLQRTSTASYNNFPISLLQMQSIISPALSINPYNIFENIIIDSHKHLSFQDPDKITQILSLIWNETHKWQKISAILFIDERVLKIELRNIVIRRNQIVHEGDIDMFTSQIQDIRENDVYNSVEFIKKLTDAIYALIGIP